MADLLGETVYKANTLHKEVQSHGFRWEKDIIVNVYGALIDELANIKYTSKVDLPCNLNRLDRCDLSVKTSCNKNGVCMADCLRIFDAVNRNSETPFHMVVIHYNQDDTTHRKNISSILGF